MRVSDSARVLFVHVQKTGGSTVDDMIDREVPDARRVDRRSRHATYRRILAQEPALADYWSFAFVRNPWARMVSWWSMVHEVFADVAAGDAEATRRVTSHPGVWEPHRPFADDFERFVLEGTETVPKLGRPQVAMLRAPGGRTVDFVGRNERFAADLNHARERLGLPPVDAPPRRNTSSHGDYRDYYDDRTRTRVAEVFDPDLREFGYTFE